MLLRDELYAWMKNLALFYLLFSVFQHLLPDRSYERYVRFFMGLILIFLFCIPLLTLLGNGQAFLNSFNAFWEEETQLWDTDVQEKIEAEYLKNSLDEEFLHELERKYGFTSDTDEKEYFRPETSAMAGSASDRNFAGDSVYADIGEEQKRTEYEVQGFPME